MTYRDERDALRERVESLEEDLGEAERKLAEQKADEDKRARIEQIEQRMNEAQRELAALSGELASMRGDKPAPAPPKSRVPLLVGVTATFVMCLVAGALLAVGKAPPPRAPNISENPAIITAPVPPLPAETAPEETPAPLPAPQKREATARFTGKVTRAQGLPIARGATCEITASLEGDGQKASVTDVSVKCGGRFVYRSTDTLEGMSMNGSGLAEGPGKAPGTLVYALRYHDTGSRAGPRTQVSLDTTQNQGAAWSEVVPIFRVEFDVAAESAPVAGERLMKDKDKP